MTIHSDVFISVVAPVRNTASIIADFITDVMGVLRASYAHYELVLVEDGSLDDTVLKILELLTQYECIRLIRLSREFGEDIAISAGLDSVIGDFIVVMLPNSDPPQLIPQMVQLARTGSGIIYGVRRTRADEPLLYRTAIALFYWYTQRILKLKLPTNATQFRVLSRQAVNAVIQIKNRYRYMRLLSSDVGYGHSSIVYDPIRRTLQGPRRTFLDRLRTATDIIVANSRHPLRLVTLIGILGSLLNVSYTIYVIVVNIVKKNVAEGWTTLSLQSAGMFFLLFVILTVLSEYVGHILSETGERPLYYVLEEQNSPVEVADVKRRNVVKESYAQ